MKESQFLGTIFLHSPLLSPILERIREKYGIDEIDPAEDGLTKRLFKDIEDDKNIDWKAVRQDLEKEIRNIPDLLPSEFATYQKILLAGKNLPVDCA